MSFIDHHRDEYGVESICAQLPIAPSTYYEHKAREANPTRVPARARRDGELKVEIKRVWDDNFQVYGVRKVWRQLNRERIPAARCTVARLMRDLNLPGAVRGRQFKTTVSKDELPRPIDHVNRNFVVQRPNALWVSDLTYVATWHGLVYVAFVIDAFARRIVGWRASSARLWRSMHSNRRSTIVHSTPTRLWFITAIAVFSICRFATPSVSPRPASNRRWGVSATPTITRWLNPSSGCTKPKSFAAVARGGTSMR